MISSAVNCAGIICNVYYIYISATLLSSNAAYGMHMSMQKEGWGKGGGVGGRGEVGGGGIGGTRVSILGTLGMQRRHILLNKYV